MRTHAPVMMLVGFYQRNEREKRVERKLTRTPGRSEEEDVDVDKGDLCRDRRAVVLTRTSSSNTNNSDNELVD